MNWIDQRLESRRVFRSFWNIVLPFDRTNVIRILKQGDINFDLDELQCIDSATGLDVKRMKTTFSYTRQSMVFQDMESVG